MVFARTPELGKVKTRLIPHLGVQTATQLYLVLLQHTLHTVSDVTDADVVLYVAGTASHPLIRQYQQQYGLRVETQQGRDLGERMANAFQHELENYQQVIVVGCDCPGLSRQDYYLAIETLRSGKQAVIAPAYDGGYVLLGMSRFIPEIFQGIAWGSENVLSITREIFQIIGTDYHELATFHDVDEKNDLQYCPQQLLNRIGI